MILLYAMIAAILLSLVRGGTLRGLAEIPLQHGWIALVAFALQMIILYAPLPKSEGLWGRRTLLLLTTYGAVLVVVGLNHRIPGLRWMGVGLVLNLAVMLANGGFMPITPEALQRAGLTHLALGAEQGSRILATKDILLTRSEVSLWILGDIFIIPPPVGTVVSVGDVLLAMGAFRFFSQATRNVAATQGVATRHQPLGVRTSSHVRGTAGSQSQHRGCETTG